MLSHPSGRLSYSGATAATPLLVKDEVADSAEMKEAAEQLKALSHIRHLSDGSPSHVVNMRAQVAGPAPDARREETGSSHEAVETGFEESHAEFTMSAAKIKPAKPLARQTPRQETSCNLCSHAPFRDSSSLRKHIAAAHTRPFPCAFSFAGCNSTFGSKNEWKRHISSQHLWFNSP